MKEVIIKIPDPKFDFFMELMDQLGLEVSQKYEIPQDQINLVMDRIAKEDANPDLVKNWDDIKERFIKD